tara:strand:- start:185 stop:1324 length:1140 start_codon:yes stop_codon:yes gene_type:complete
MRYFILIFLQVVTSEILHENDDGSIQMFEASHRNLVGHLNNANAVDTFKVHGNKLVNGYAESVDSDTKRAVRILCETSGVSYASVTHAVEQCKNGADTTCKQVCGDGENGAECYCGSSNTICTALEDCTVSTSACCDICTDLLVSGNTWSDSQSRTCLDYQSSLCSDEQRIRVGGSTPSSPVVYDGVYELKTSFNPAENYLVSTTALYNGNYVYFGRFVRTQGTCTCTTFAGGNAATGNCIDSNGYSRQRTFCTNEIYADRCASAGGRNWLATGLCAFTATNSANANDWVFAIGSLVPSYDRNNQPGLVGTHTSSSNTVASNPNLLELKQGIDAVSTSNSLGNEITKTTTLDIDAANVDILAETNCCGCASGGGNANTC